MHKLPFLFSKKLRNLYYLCNIKGIILHNIFNDYSILCKVDDEIFLMNSIV